MKRKTFIKKPIKVGFKMKDGTKRFFEAMQCKYPIIELKGEPIESFEKAHKIKEIILLGEDDEIRRIILK